MTSPAETDDEADRFEGTPHPRHATELFGHDAVERDLLDAYRTDRLPHAIILGGAAGIGKATLAWRLARFILTYPIIETRSVREARDLGVPPNGKAAAQIASLSHPDVALLRRETNEKTKRFYTEIRADDVRRTIQLFQRAAGAGGYRVCIIDSAEDLNRSSANALLKLIEEPPPKSLFLLVAHRPGLILPTIRSRARLVRLQPLLDATTTAIIGSLGHPWTGAGSAAVAKAAAQGKGSIHDALRLLSGNGLDLDALVSRLLQRLPHVDWRDVHKLADQVAGRDGERGFEITMAAIRDWLSDAVRQGASGQGAIAGQDGARRLAPFADAWEKVTADARETDALNLDKRPLLMTIFTDLATAVRTSAQS